jgi:hypothetical protein
MKQLNIFDEIAKEQFKKEQEEIEKSLFTYKELNIHEKINAKTYQWHCKAERLNSRVRKHKENNRNNNYRYWNSESPDWKQIKWDNEKNAGVETLNWLEKRKKQLLLI